MDSLAPKNQDVVKSNALIEAVYNPGSVYQMRLLMAALMQIKAKEKVDFRREYVITANSLADMTGSVAQNNYAELKGAADDLMNQVVTIKNNPNGEPGKPSRTKINLVSSCEYYDGEGRVSLRFTEEILPYVSDLKNRFTQYQAKYVMPMRSSYGIRLYELCLQWLGEEREFSVDEFRQLFGLKDKYKSIKDLKKYVVYKALDDINTHSDIRVSFGQRKAGRRVSHFQFMIVKPQPKVKALGIRDWITKYKMAKPGESWETAISRLKTNHAKYKNDPAAWLKQREESD